MLFCAISKYKLKCVDSLNVPVDIENCAIITPELSSNMKVDSNPVLLSLSIQITGAQTSLITDKNGTSQTVSTLAGTSKRINSQNKKICLADKNVMGLTNIRTSNVSMCEVAISGTSGSNPATDTLTIWVSDAGQDKVEVE